MFQVKYMKHCFYSILEPPPTPQNLTILEISSRSVKIAWSLDRNASPGVERLVIQWKEQSGKFGIIYLN